MDLLIREAQPSREQILIQHLLHQIVTGYVCTWTSDGIMWKMQTYVQMGLQIPNVAGREIEAMLELIWQVVINGKS